MNNAACGIRETGTRRLQDLFSSARFTCTEEIRKMLNVRTLPDTTGNRGADLLRVSLKVQSLSLDESEKFVEKRKSESSDVQDN
ncbi:uncharacterized protein LOC107273674 isoform X4 [Cephus cinctus]|nr:uncharacterized protein LOC107273674 isoform X4 [Cephus cinctus]